MEHPENAFSFQLWLGNGGTTDTANTGRKFLGEKRDQFLNLVKEVRLLSLSSTICTVTKSTFLSALLVR